MWYTSVRCLWCSGGTGAHAATCLQIMHAIDKKIDLKQKVNDLAVSRRPIQTLMRLCCLTAPFPRSCAQAENRLFGAYAAQDADAMVVTPPPPKQTDITRRHRPTRQARALRKHAKDLQHTAVTLPPSPSCG